MTRISVLRSPYPVVVIGGGITGLAAAFRLQRAGVDVRVFEADQRAGGMVRSRRHNGHLFEDGPTTVMSTSEHLGRLIDDAGLRSRVVTSAKIAGRRLVWRHGRLHALPEKPPHLLTCSALSLAGRARLLMEPLIPAKKDRRPETLEAFGLRRLGREATAGLLDPFVSGVFAGSLDRLGVDAFQRLAIWERAHGSLFKAMIHRRKIARQEREAKGEAPRSGPAPLISLPDGLGELPDTLAKALGSKLHRGERVSSVGRVGAHWRVSVDSAKGEAKNLMASALIVATPAREAASLVEPWVGAQMSHFRDLEQPHVATVGLGFKRPDIAHSLDAFGLLCAGDSRIPDDVLGVLFVSSIFPGRAPEGEVSLTTMIGGSRDPLAARDDDSALLERTRGALATLLGARGEPTAQSVVRWPRAIPQYPPGHGDRVEALQGRLSGLAGLKVAGNWLAGPGLEAAVGSADQAVAETLASEWTATGA